MHNANRQITWEQMIDNKDRSMGQYNRLERDLPPLTQHKEIYLKLIPSTTIGLQQH